MSASIIYDNTHRAIARNDLLDAGAERLISRTRALWAGRDEELLPMDACIGVAIGYAALTCDGRPVYEQEHGELAAAMSVLQAERIAAAAPQRDWKIHLIGQLDERHYRRIGAAQWKLYRRGYGLS